MKMKLPNITMKVSDNLNVSANLSLDEPKRKEYQVKKAKVIDNNKKKKPGALF